MVGHLRRSGGLVPPMLALVLLFRLLIPAGYMIAPGDGGRPGLVLCGAAAGASVERARHQGHDGHPAAPAPVRPGEIPCPFAALASPPLPPAPPSILPPAPTATAPPRLVSGDGLHRPALAAPPPPATGPPVPV